MLLTIEQALNKAIDFLAKEQLPSGEFPAFVSRDEGMHNPIPVKSAFIASCVLHSLRYVRSRSLVSGVVTSALNFLLSERGPDGMWKSLGLKLVPPDTDCTSCAVACLYEWGVNLDYEEVTKRLLAYRLDQGPFLTWVLDTDPAVVQLDNDVDRVVNANAMNCFSLLHLPLPEVEKYLRDVVISTFYECGSKHYPSPFSLTYCLSRAVTDGGARTLEDTLPRMLRFLEEKQLAHGGFGSSVEDALGAVAMLNCRGDFVQVDQAVGHLLQTQRDDGGWEASPFFVGPVGYFYGSPSLTTAIAAEALAKFLRLQGY